MVRTPRPDPSDTGSRVHSPDNLARWEVQMHETARDLSAQLDSKMAALAELVRQADRVATRLESTLSDTQEPADSSRANPAATRDQAEGLKGAGADRKAQPAEGGDGGSGAVGRAVSSEDRYAEIYMLADYGFDTLEIAHRAHLPAGEVELILGLREQRRGAAGG